MTDTGDRTGHDLLEEIEDGDVHDMLLGYMDEGQSAEEALKHLLFALPSFTDLECKQCGRDLEPLDENDFVALRLKVAESDYRRTDLYCGPACFRKTGSGGMA